MPKFKLKARVEKLEDVTESFRPAYVERDGAFHLDPEKLEAIDIDDRAELSGALENERNEAKALRTRLEALKDVDPERYRTLLAEADERSRDGKKKAGDWEGWKATFEQDKEKSDAAFKLEIENRDKRIQKFLLDDKIKSAALEAGVRKKLVDHVATNTKQFFRLDKDENVEVLDDKGNPINVTALAFFKDKYVTEFPEYYEPTGQGGSGASNNGNNGSRGGARVISFTDQAGLNSNIDAIAKGDVVVRGAG